jgi:hypothetical protein
MKEFEGIKDIKGCFLQNNAFASWIPSNSFIPNSNGKQLVAKIDRNKIFHPFRYFNKGIKKS